MKKLFFASLSLLIIYACSSAESKAEIKLESMVCGSCSSTIQGEMSKIDGIVKIEINDKNKVGVFTYKATIINLDAIEHAISKLGYSANDTQADPVAYESLASCCKIGSK